MSQPRSEARAPRVFASSRGPRRAPLAIDPRALDAEWEPSANEEPFVYMEDGVAVVDVRGPLCQFPGWFWDGYGGECGVVARFRAAVASSAPAILLTIGSPGGDVEGLFESCRVMRQLASAMGKPVVAYVDESAYSAAYAIAAVADAVYLPPSGGVGSIGVIGELVDVTRAEEKAGIRVEVVTSGDQKADGHPSVPLTDEVIKRAQRRINQLAGIFFDWVSMRRGLSLGEIEALQAGCVYGPGAVAAGLADGVKSRRGALRAAQKLGGVTPTA